jgi:hypothetical protein
MYLVGPLSLRLVRRGGYPHNQDVVVLHVRFLTRAGSGEYELEPEQLFSSEEQVLFTRSLALAEKNGKTIHLAVAAATEKWDAILRAAQSIQSSIVVWGFRQIDRSQRRVVSPDSPGSVCRHPNRS